MIAVALFLPKGDSTEAPLSRLALFIGAAPLAAAAGSVVFQSVANLVVALVTLVWLQRDRIRWKGACWQVWLSLVGRRCHTLDRVSGVRPIRVDLVGRGIRVFFESPNAVLSGRIDAWQTLANYLIAHPWSAVIGVGYKTLPYSDFIGAKAVGDNTYLTLLAETGIAGLCALVALNIAILIYAYRAARSPHSVRSFTGAWMFCFWAGQCVQMFSADLLTGEFCPSTSLCSHWRPVAPHENPVSRSVQRIRRRTARSS